MTLAPGDPRHGTENGYRNHDCRCDRCRTANTDYTRERGICGYKRDVCACGRSKVVSSARCRACEVAAREPAHGTEGRYTSRRFRCRCDLCRAASAAGRRRRRAGAAA